MEHQLETIKSVLADFKKREDDLSAQEKAIKTDINDTITQLYQELKSRKNELHNQLQKLVQEKFVQLSAEKEQVVTTQAQLSSCLDFLRETFKKTGNQSEVLLMKKNTVAQVRELTAAFQPRP